MLIATMLAIPAAAQADPADPYWTCRASVLRASVLPGVLPIPDIEPLVANGNESPCADGDQAVPEIAIPPAPSAAIITANAIFARTDVLCADDEADPADTPDNNDECDAGRPSYDQQVVSRAGAADLVVALPGLTITADAIDAQARAYCDSDNRPHLDASTQFADIAINGNHITLPPNGDELVIPLDPLIRIVFNERAGDTAGQQADDDPSGQIIRRALHVTVGPVATPVADVVLGEAKAGFNGDVCPEGTVVVKQETTPEEEPNATNFGFETSGGLSPDFFTLQDDGTTTYADVAAGSHAITQLAPPAAYTTDQIICAENKVQDTTVTLPARRANVELQQGETVTCTYLDTKERIIEPPPGTCPPGSTANSEGVCIVNTTTCPAGSVKDPVSGVCNVGCPAGSVKDPAGKCVITNVVCPDGTTFSKQTGQCLDLPTGGKLVPLTDVLGFQTSPCRGARFGLGVAVVGTNGMDRITGTNRSDRIFAYGGRDRVSGGRGNDCVEGGSGNDYLDGSNGNDRLIGGTGSDRIQGGFGNDRLDGGSGNDGIHTGNGKDVVYGGSGNDIINAATVDKPAFVDCGPGKRDRVRINTNELNRTRNCEFRYILRRVNKKK